LLSGSFRWFLKHVADRGIDELELGDKLVREFSVAIVNKASPLPQESQLVLQGCDPLKQCLPFRHEPLDGVR
jgi:hypothetical protein